MQELADRCDWNKAKTSRIEAVRTTPSDADIHAWCIACGVEGRAADLIEASRSADSMYMEWRRLQRTGMRRLQKAGIPLYQRTAVFRIYCARVIPGMLQTEGYATAILSTIAEFRRVPNDSAQAAAARVDRAKVIRDGRHRVVFLVEEDALYQRYGDEDVMRNQLHYLLTTMSLPAVSLGIIPRAAARAMWGVETFTVFDDKRVHVELLAAKVAVTTPSEVEIYLRACARLSEMAVHGPQARSLINEAIHSLG